MAGVMLQEVRRSKVKRRLLVVSIILGMMIVGQATAGPADTLQDPEPRGLPLTYDNPVLYFYGEQDNSKTHDQWDAWNHADQSDTQSDNSFSEFNFPGAANNGGGSRQFTFDGSYPVEVLTLLNPEEPLVGRLALQISCNTQSCQQQVRVALLVDEREYTSVTVNEPDPDDDYYHFEFFSSLDRLEPGESIGVKVEFTKPSQMNEGYSLDLGRDNFELIVPVLPPEEVIIPGTGGEQAGYESPYSNSTLFFTQRDVSTQSLAPIIVWGTISFVIIIPMGMFIPSLPWGMKPTGIALFLVSMLLTLTAAPAIAYFDSPSDMEVGSAGVAAYTTPADIVVLDAAPDQFLAGITNETTLRIYVEYDRFYISSVGGFKGTVNGVEPLIADATGIGFEPYAEVIGGTEATNRGIERLQLYFSLIDTTGLDLQSGHGLIITANFQRQCDGCPDVVPTWAAWDSPDETLTAGTQQAVLEDGSPRYIVPAGAVEVTNMNPTWSGIPMYTAMPLAVIAFLIGGLQIMTMKKAWEANKYDDDEIDDDWEEDEEFDDDEIDVDEFDLLD